MLNLSDKELDRFSKEAAQEYEPGDVLGERSWEMLEVRLDRDLGRVTPNPLRHIRRFPFYYAPAMLVLLGVSYYLIRRSGSPPLRAVKSPAAVVQSPSSNQSPVNTEKSTPPASTATPATAAEQAGGDAVGKSAGGAAAGVNGAAGNAGAGATSAAVSNGGANANGAATAANDVAKGAAGASAGANGSAKAGAGVANTANAAGASGAGAAVAGNEAVAGTRGSRGHGHSHQGLNGKGNKGDHMLAITAPANAGRVGAGGGNDAASSVGAGGNGAAGRNSVAGQGVAVQSAQEKELGRTTLQGLRQTKKAPHIGDSALRAFTLKSTAPQLIRKGGAHINRSLEFGVLAAPDFASVNSLAGDRPGSTIGVTVDYQFANHLYIGSGLLLDRKIFAARAQDFHAPPGWYQDNGMHGDVDLIKGSFEMLEIPLNLRYDFSVTGSTLFFISGGVSSYLLTSENNNYYYHPPFQFRDECRSIASPDKSFLFSALNFSLGVETGLSNSLSLLIAPYVKVPVRGVGIGQVQMSTVGVNFALRFAPIISRKRY